MPTTYDSGTTSHQTSRQMPLCAVYQMPPRSTRCLPRGCVPASDGSKTHTASSFLSPGRRASVTSAEKGR